VHKPVISLAAKSAQISEPAQPDATAALLRSNHVDLEVKVADAASKAIDEAGR
jgi:hypothetical protein